MTLPLFLKPEKKIIAGWFLFISAAVIYLASNHYHVYSPRFLPLTWVDQNTPFTPWTIWLYTSEWPFFIYTYLAIKNIENTNKYLYSFFIMQIIAAVFFVIWPTTYPRDQFPLLPETMDYLTYKVFLHVRNMDTPANCCPSLHVSTVILCALIFLEEQREKFLFLIIWALMISFSTLTTKQHYLADVVSGCFLGWFCYWLFFKKITYTHPKKTDNTSLQMF